MDKLKAWIAEGRGRVVKIAEACGISHSAVSQWTRIPVDHVQTIEGLTGIPREQLRPDVYTPRQRRKRVA